MRPPFKLEAPRQLPFLIALLTSCTIRVDTEDTGAGVSVGTTLGQGTANASASSSGAETTGGECDYECEGVACNFTCMGESIWVCTGDSEWELVADCSTMDQLCELVGASYECVDPAGDGDGDPSDSGDGDPSDSGDGDPGGPGDCVSISTTEPPLVPMSHYASCIDVFDCLDGYDLCVEGQCSKSCLSDADCPPAPGYAPECVEIACSLSCSATSDCPGGLLCCDGRCRWP